MINWYKKIALMGIFFVLLFLVLFLFGAVSARAQDYPNLKNVKVDSQVRYDQQNSMYFYTYDIFNSKSSIGEIFVLEIKLNLYTKLNKPDTTGLIFANQFMQWSFREIYPSLKGRIVPVGFPKIPSGWNGTLSHHTRSAGFNGFPNIAPGESLKGFEMMSRGLPSIRKFTARPSFDVDKYFPSIEDTSKNAMTIAEMDSIRNSLNYSGFTIGPSLPPVPFSDRVFSDTLMSYTSQACNLKWIDNKGICQSLQTKLQNVQKQLGKGKTKTAINDLQAFLNEVGAQKGKHLTSEGYGLLYFNGKYLKQQLEKQ
jgi:hypothetical protein